MLYAHGSDLCHELELRHAMANCFEALMGALLLDGGIDVADKVFAKALYQDDEKLREACPLFGYFLTAFCNRIQFIRSGSTIRRIRCRNKNRSATASGLNPTKCSRI